MFKEFGATMNVPTEVLMVVIYVLWVLGLLMAKKIVMKTIQGWAKNTETPVDDIFIAAAHWPLVFLICVSGGFAVARFLPSEAQTEFFKSFSPLFKAITILAVIVFTNKFLLGLLKEYTPKFEILRDTAGIVGVMIRFMVFGLGLLILLDSFGVSITPLLASLGIGSLAIALALQPTLENLFAGIQIVVDKPVQVGHFIRLDTGEEGYVERIGWRSTWIRLPPNNMMILPNKGLVNARIMNYYYPDQETVVTVDFGVHYSSDLEKIEKVTLEVARQTLKEVPDGVADFEPAVRFHTLGDSGIQLTVVLRAREVTKAGNLKHEFIKRLVRRYSREGIVIPYPIRAVNYAQEKTDIS